MVVVVTRSVVVLGTASGRALVSTRADAVTAGVGRLFSTTTRVWALTCLVRATITTTTRVNRPNGGHQQASRHPWPAESLPEVFRPPTRSAFGKIARAHRCIDRMFGFAGSDVSASRPTLSS